MGPDNPDVTRRGMKRLEKQPRIYIYIFIYRFESPYRGLKKKEKRKNFANGIVKLQREFSAALVDGDSVFYTLNVDGSGSRLIVLGLILVGWITRMDGLRELENRFWSGRGFFRSWRWFKISPKTLIVEPCYRSKTVFKDELCLIVSGLISS